MVAVPTVLRALMVALEKPHWGASGVPFMKTTHGYSETTWTA
jgi:hypothetical protein